jgi:hypothetical protein
MKTFLNTLQSIFKRFTYGEKLHPAHDWFALISLAAILFAVSIGWNILLFRNFQTQKVTHSATTTPAQVTIGNSIPQIQEIFKNRATEEVNYQQVYHFVDPSLPGS